MKQYEIRTDGKAVSIRCSIEEAFERLVAQTERRESTAGRSSGSKKIDALCGRMQPGDLLVYAGYPGQYKTSLVVQIAYTTAADKAPVLWCSSTLSIRQLSRRLLAVAARTPLTRINAAKIPGKHWPELTRAVGRFVDDVSFYCTTAASAGPNLDDLKKLILQHDIQLLVIDPLRISSDCSTPVPSTLKQLAVDCNIPVIAVIDLPAPLMRENKPDFSELPQIMKSDEDTDSLCLIYRENMPGPNGDGGRVECLNISNGAETCRLFLSREHQEFMEEPGA